MKIFNVLLLMLLLALHANAQDRVGTNKSFVSDLSFSSGGTLLAAAEDQSVSVYHFPSRALQYSLSGGHQGNVLSVAISPDSSKIISGGKDGKVVLWDLAKGKTSIDLYKHQGLVTRVRFSADGRYVASGGLDNKVLLYDIVSMKKIGEYLFHKDDVTALAFLKDEVLISADADGLLAFWDVSSGQLIASQKDPNKWIRDMAIDKENKYLYTSGDNSKVSRWAVSDLQHIQRENTYKYGLTWLMGVDVFGAYKTYAFGNMDGLVCIASSLNLFYMQKIGSPVTKVLFQPNQPTIMQLAVGTYGGGVVFLDASTMQISKSYLRQFTILRYGKEVKLP